MTYFADLTPHTYTAVGDDEVVNVGWLGEGHPYPTGATSAAFRRALERLCQRPVGLHRGFHVCELCPPELARTSDWTVTGNGQVRIQGQNGTWYAAPTMIHHYVVAHDYKPPDKFVAAVLNPRRVADSIPSN